MADLNINSVANVDSVTANDYVYISQGGSALKKIAYDDLIDSVYSNGEMFSNVAGSCAGAHNSIFRGKNLGTSYTATQAAEIAAGRFTDLFVGDYWTINGTKFVIAHFDPMWRCGDTQLTTHHIAVVPAANLYNAQMQNTESGGYIAGNEYNYTTGGYVASDMRTTNLAAATTTFENAFGSSHVLTYRDLLTTATGTYSGITNKATSWAWNDCKVELMSETMVYGQKVFGLSPYEVGCMCFQLALFRLCPEYIHTRQTYWLRNVSSATQFAYVNGDGYANNYGASLSRGVRPLALIS